jgi:ribonuclease HI
MLEDGHIRIIVDGSGNGHSAAYFSEDEVYFTYQQGATNNEAEYNAVILALERLPDGAKALVLSDSELVVKQLLGKYRCNYPHLNEKRRTIQSLINNKNLEVTFKWIPREQNLADGALRNHLANSGKQTQQPESVYDKVKRLEEENCKLREENTRLREEVVGLKVRIG